MFVSFLLVLLVADALVNDDECTCGGCGSDG